MDNSNNGLDLTGCIELLTTLWEMDETFYEKRWKFILEYNKVEKTHQKKKKEAELRRLLNLIGMAKLV